LVGEELSGPTATPLYSLAVFDLDAGSGDDYVARPRQAFHDDADNQRRPYTQPVYYGAGSHTLTREMIGTRYAGVAVRVLVDPRDKNDLRRFTLFKMRSK